MEHCAPWVFRCLLFQLMHHFFYRQQEGSCFPSAQTILSTWIAYHSNLDSLFWILLNSFENKLLETFLLLLLFFFLFFFTHHSISHEIKTVICVTQKYTLLSYYNNDFTPSKKIAVQQLSRHQVSYIRDDRHWLCKYQTSFTCQGKKVSS